MNNMKAKLLRIIKFPSVGGLRGGLFPLLLLFSLAIAGCGKENTAPDERPQTPSLSPSTVTVEEEKAVEVTVSGGKSPYTASISPAGVAALSLSGNKLSVTGVKAGSAVATVKGSDGGSATLQVTVTAKPDPLAAFKADAALRWELPDGTVIRDGNTAFVFIADANKLFSSAQNKWGYASLSGMSFRLIEWGASPAMRTETGTTAVTDFQTVKEESGKVWITFKASGTAHRVVAAKL
jgi:hypothetical protein